MSHYETWKAREDASGRSPRDRYIEGLKANAAAVKRRRAAEHAQATRYPDLGYELIDRGLWRVVDRQTGNVIGPQYRTRAELLADLDRFAGVYGADQ